MRMYGVFAKPQMSTAADLTAAEAEKEWQKAVAESDKNPVALCRYSDTASEIVNKYENGMMEIREVEVTAFDVLTRRPVSL